MAKSLQDFVNWAVNTKVVSNPGVNTYPGQCVSLVQEYLSQVFGIPYAARGNAKDFVPPTFTQVSGGLRPGDIVRYGANFGGGYGHVGIIDDDGRFIDQNGLKRLAVGRSASPFGGYTAIFRPTKAFSVKNAPAPSAGGRIAQAGTFTANQNMNIRRAPVDGQVVATLTTGSSVKYDSYIDAGGVRWISYIGNSGNRNYIARRKLDNSVIYGSAV